MNGNHYDSKKLVKWREDSGKTQQVVATVLSVDRNTISRAEKGQVASYDLLVKLCFLYGKSMHELIYAQPIAKAA